MDKKEIMEEFLKEKSEKNIIENVELIEENKKKDVSEIKNIENLSKKKKKKKKKKNKVEGIINEFSEDKKNYFSSAKNELLKNENIKSFAEFLEEEKEKTEYIFSFDFFIEAKIKYPILKTLIIEPSEKDLTTGNKFFLLKPVNHEEYSEFSKKVGSKEAYPNEFAKFLILKSLLFPENITMKEIEQMPVGIMLSIYTTALDISDLNKTYRILEV